MDFIIDNKNHTLDQKTLEDRLKALATLKKNKAWIRKDLTSKQSTAIGRRFWIIAKHFQWARSIFYHVNLTQTRTILLKISPQILDGDPNDLQEMFKKAVINFNAIAPRHRVLLDHYHFKTFTSPLPGPSSSAEIEKKIAEIYEPYQKAFAEKYPAKEISEVVENEEIEVFFDRMLAKAYNENRLNHLKNCKKYLNDFLKKTPKNKDAWVFSEGITEKELAFNRFFANFLKGISTPDLVFPEPDFIKNSFSAESFFEEFFTFPINSTGAKGEEAHKTLEALFQCKIETYQDLKQAYKKWALKNHPDKVAPHEEAAATAKFQEVGQLIMELRAAKKWD